VANTLAYYDKATITAVISFIVQAPGPVTDNHFYPRANPIKVLHSGRLRPYLQTLH
jgi:hypothetical protein